MFAASLRSSLAEISIIINNFFSVHWHASDAYYVLSSIALCTTHYSALCETETNKIGLRDNNSFGD